MVCWCSNVCKKLPSSEFYTTEMGHAAVLSLSPGTKWHPQPSYSTAWYLGGAWTAPQHLNVCWHRACCSQIPVPNHLQSRHRTQMHPTPFWRCKQLQPVMRSSAQSMLCMTFLRQKCCYHIWRGQLFMRAQHWIWSIYGHISVIKI